MRDDITNKLVHLTKGINPDKSKHREEALLNLMSIIQQKKLNGGDGFIRGSYKCVCFSEAPIGKLAYVIAGGSGNEYKYQPYGVMVAKKWLFEKGGLPVIYSPADEFDKLPEEMRYRHVRFSLEKRAVDFSWEREWRIKTDSLDITPEDVTLVVPDRAAKDLLQSNFGNEWHFVVLSDMGVEIAPL
jgi:hypothetical protein